MAEFPPNLDDGEFWLPSDIFINEAPSYNTHHLSCMDYYLAQHLAALSLLQNRPSRNLFNKLPPKPAPNSQRVKPVGWDISVNHLPLGSFGVNGGAEPGQRLRGCGTGPFVSGSDSFYKFQVDNSLEITRAGVLQRQQKRLQNRVYPFQGSGLGYGGGLVRESGGTGVFHARIVNPTTAIDVKGKQGVRNRQEVEVTQQRNSTRRVCVNKQEDCYYHLPPGMGLPHDWTY